MFKKLFSKPIFRRLFLGGGGAVENAFQNAPITLASPIFNVGMGLSPVLIGIAVALPRIWEILLDPWIGVKSDRFRSRWGKRTPFIFWGTLISALLFALIWWVPVGWSLFAKGVWLIISLLLFYTAYSFFAVPYAALTIEQTEEGPDRVGVMVIRTAFATLSGIALNWLYWLAQRDCFENAVVGMRWVGLGFGLLIGLFGLLPLLVLQRSRDPVPSAVEPKQEASSFKPLLKMPILQCLIIALLGIMVSFTLVGQLGFYTFAYFGCAGDLKLAALVGAQKATLTSILGILACPVVSWLSKKMGKQNTLQGLLLLGGIGSVCTWWTITPVNPYYSVSSDLCVMIGLVGFWSLMPAFLGDVSDLYQAKTGESCQGQLAAIYGVAVKIGASSALLLTGYVLIFCDFPKEITPESMREPLRSMRLLYAAIPGIGIAIAMGALHYFYKIYHKEINKKES